MYTHTYAICAYKDSPYLEACVRSLKGQTVPSSIILCTSTPSSYIRGLAGKYRLPLYVREGQSDIQDDWNFAYEKADTRLVTIAHQDDRYHRDYGKQVQAWWKKYPDTTLFSTDCLTDRGGKIRRWGAVPAVKRLLRLPLRFHGLADRPAVKKAALFLGNPVICPSCTYDKETLGELLSGPLFDSPYKFALDWDTLWKLAQLPGRFVCVEKPLLCYRIHDGAATKACIRDHRREQEEGEMFRKIWPGPAAAFLMRFYRKSYGTYD